MKRKVLQGLGIASLCLATAISALSGIALLDNQVAFADEAETMRVTDFVYTNVATEKITQDENGLRISSDEPYKATFKTVFKGNTQFNFRFPETYTNALYGDFTFHIADAVDNSKFFEIKYYVESETAFATAPYVQYQDEIRMCVHNVNGEWFNTKVTNKTNYRFAPCFLSKAYDETRNERMGTLELLWIGDVLTVSSNTTGLQDSNPKKPQMRPIASFDGTYNEEAKNNGFVNLESWGLPKMKFSNGYTVTVSSSFYDKRTTDRASDVLFDSIINANATYAFAKDVDGNPPKTEFVLEKQMKAFRDGFEYVTTQEATEGKYFLGWRNKTTNELYPEYSTVPKGDYEAFEITYDTMDSASVRIDDSGIANSGIRFRTLFNVDEYHALESHIKSKGTLITYTDKLIADKDFTIENYKKEAAFAQIENTKGVFEYTETESGDKYMVYSMAVINIAQANYTRAYSARGYLVIEYTDGSTQLIYTDYDATNNSRSIAEVANSFKQTEEYTTVLTEAEKAIVDAYAAAYVAPVEPNEPTEPTEPNK